MKEKLNITPPTWIDQDDVPELTDEWFEHADLYHGDKLVRRGRPKVAATKQSVTIRYDAEVVEYFRATGPGWQSRINTALKEWINAHSSG